LLALCLALTAVVGLYQKYYSFEAVSRSRSLNATSSAVETPSPAKISAASISPPPAEVTADGNVDTPVQPAAFPADSPEVIEASLSPESDTAAETDNTATAERNKPVQEIHTEEWLQELPSNHYVIQIASSANYDVLVKLATNWSVNAPLIIYPSTVNEQGKLMYGLSTGLFIAKEDAVTEVPRLEEISNPDGVWVRKVSTMKNKLASLRNSQPIQ